MPGKPRKNNQWRHDISQSLSLLTDFYCCVCRRKNCIYRHLIMYIPCRDYIVGVWRICSCCEKWNKQHNSSVRETRNFWLGARSIVSGTLFWSRRVSRGGRGVVQSKSTFRILLGKMWLAKRGKGMLLSVEQVLVGKSETRCPNNHCVGS